MTEIASIVDQPDQARAAIGQMPPPGLVSAYEVALSDGATVVTLGTRLAPALANVLEVRGYRRIRTDAPHSALPPLDPEAAEYAESGTGTGAIGHPVAIEQLVRRCAGDFKPAQDRWHHGNLVIDPFRPGLRYPARSDREFDVLTDRYLTGLKSALRRAKVLLVSVNAVEFHEAEADRAALPAWPAGELPEGYQLRKLGVRDAMLSLVAAVKAARKINPDLHVLIMVSPEPIKASESDHHILAADLCAKAALRLALDQMPPAAHVTYLPALELAGAMGVTGDAVISDAQFLSALAQAVIAPRILPLPAPVAAKPRPKPPTDKETAAGVDAPAAPVPSASQTVTETHAGIGADDTAAAEPDRTDAADTPHPRRRGGGQGRKKGNKGASADQPRPSDREQADEPSQDPAAEPAPGKPRNARRARREAANALATQGAAAAASEVQAPADGRTGQRRKRKTVAQDEGGGAPTPVAASPNEASPKPRRRQQAAVADPTIPVEAEPKRRRRQQTAAAGSTAPMEAEPKRRRRKQAAEQVDGAEPTAPKRGGRRRARQDTAA